ncbi:MULTISPECIES: PEP-CTERM sorting domain-containing protein [unclassified Massilia]|uniref:PEP-CTERM sorting domain-containing protein n=1 Tax=unclassified Massilia TaxID=2609279 RepID=UPI00177D0DE6|nr:MULTISPECIES: PEP-CTERM sorting domain-containing protein [unclassified Massilia]MBD8533412.1 PEP-CTERM sorting domain-containing protein [Massilia sp. CFBP 13647]MBD8676810.1 PEP-CTERM sorting domain-containing protein [Massilia sp. CFBP 13721]
MKNLVLAFAALALASSASATTINFDSMTPGVISNGTAGIDKWTNLYSLNATSQVGNYADGIVSGKNVAYNGSGSSAGLSDAEGFTFNSAYFTAVWTPLVDLQLRAYDSKGILKYSFDTTLDHKARNINLGWTGIGSMTMAGFTAGTKNTTWFAMDNLVINEAVNAVPEPGSIALLGLGIAGLMAGRRRKVA